MGKDRYGISKSARVADDSIALDVGILPEASIFADHATRRDMREMPNLGVLSDFRSLLDIGCRMDKCIGSIFLRLDHKSTFPLSRTTSRSATCPPRPLPAGTRLYTPHHPRFCISKRFYMHRKEAT